MKLLFKFKKIFILFPYLSLILIFIFIFLFVVEKPLRAQISQLKKQETLTKDVKQLATPCVGTPLDIMLIIDVSGSMNISDIDGFSGTRLEYMIIQSRNFMQRIKFLNSSKPDTLKDRIGIVVFADTLRTDPEPGWSNGALLVHNLSYNYDSVIASLNTFTASGATCLECGIVKANNHFAGAGFRPGVRRIAISLSDGQTNSHLEKSYNELGSEGKNDPSQTIPLINESKKRAYNAAVAGYNSLGINHFPAILAPQPDEDFQYLKDIARDTKGVFLLKQNYKALNEVYDQYYDIIYGSYEIRGIAYVDLNGDKIYKPADDLILPGATINITAVAGNSPPPVVTNSNGEYVFSGLCAGNYTISIEKPTEYSFYDPIAGAYNITLGENCQTPPASSATCSNGNIYGLNFALRNSTPWMQGFGIDMRTENSGFATQIPDQTSCPKYALQPNKSTTPGVIFTGGVNAQFGTGKASSTNWVVGGTQFPEIFRSSQQIVKTSYSYMSAVLRKNGITPIKITTQSQCSNLSSCFINNNFGGTVYTTDIDDNLATTEDLVVTSPSGEVKLSNNKPYIIFVNGNLRINVPITVNNGTLMFIVRGDIIVNENIGTTSFSCNPNSAQLQGIYSADKSFIIKSYGSCKQQEDSGIKDKMLNVEGVIVTNAAGNGGEFRSSRDLCENNSLYPAFTVRSRLSYILNLPGQILTRSRIFQETAP